MILLPGLDISRLTKQRNKVNMMPWETHSIRGFRWLMTPKKKQCDFKIHAVCVLSVWMSRVFCHACWLTDLILSVQKSHTLDLAYKLFDNSIHVRWNCRTREGIILLLNTPTKQNVPQNAVVYLSFFHCANPESRLSYPRPLISTNV